EVRVHFFAPVRDRNRRAYEWPRHLLELVQLREAAVAHGPEFARYREAVRIIDDQRRMRAEVERAIPRLRDRFSDELLTREQMVVPNPAFQCPVDEQNRWSAGHSSLCRESPITRGTSQARWKSGPATTTGMWSAARSRPTTSRYSTTSRCPTST